MEITIILNGNSEYELYNEFMNKLLKYRTNNNKTAKTKCSLKELFSTIQPFCIKTAERVFPAEYKDITKDPKKLRVFVNNLKAVGIIKACGYTKPQGSTRLYVSYCGVDYDSKSMTVEADGSLSVEPQTLNWDPFSIGGVPETIAPKRNFIIAGSGVIISKEFADE